MRFLAHRCPWLNAVLAWGATVTSLYWSIVLGWVPCDLCWYERICMYPLGLLYGVSIIQKHHSRATTLPLAAVGMTLSLYHYLLQVVPGMSNAISCTSSVSCAIPEFAVLGFITPPLLCFAVFVTMFVVDAFGWRAVQARRLRRWRRVQHLTPEGKR